VPEIIQFVKLLTGDDVSVKRVGPMELSLIVPSTMTPNNVATLLTVVDDKTADRKFLMPLPVTARFANIVHRPPLGFRPDCVEGRPDYASVSVAVPL